MRRWEMERGLPVHRVPGGARGVVFAYADELEDWLRSPKSEQAEKTDSDLRRAVPRLRVVADIAKDESATRAEARERTSAAETSGSRMNLLPWVAAVGLALAVFGGIYSYRQTARFRARASVQRTTTLEPSRVPDPEAQDLYLKGRYYWSKRTPEDLNRAVDAFTQAIVKDPGYAPAFVGLADCYNLLREFSAMPGEEAFPRALAAAQKAVELDDTSAEAHNSLAFATFYWSWDAPAAEREFRRALELNPNFGQGHHWYATFLLAIKRFPEALDQIERARRLDPSSTTILADKGYILWLSGRKREGLALLKQLEATDLSLASPHTYLAQIYFAQKDYANFFAESKRAAELRNDRGAIAVTEAAQRGFASGGLEGMHEAMLPVQEKLFAEGKIPAYDLASTCGALGKNEEALRYLQTAFEKRNLGIMYVSENQSFNGLHDDPAYQEIAARIHERIPNAISQ